MDKNLEIETLRQIKLPTGKYLILTDEEIDFLISNMGKIERLLGRNYAA